MFHQESRLRQTQESPKKPSSSGKKAGHASELFHPCVVMGGLCPRGRNLVGDRRVSGKQAPGLLTGLVTLRREGDPSVSHRSRRYSLQQLTLF